MLKNKKFGDQRNIILNCEEIKQLMTNIVQSKTPPADDVIKTMTHTFHCKNCADYFISLQKQP